MYFLVLAMVFPVLIRLHIIFLWRSQHEKCKKTATDNGIVLNSEYSWTGFTTKPMTLDVSDVSTKLVATVDNPTNVTFAVKYIINNIDSSKSGFTSGELILTNETGIAEMNLDRVFTKQQLKVISKGQIQFQFILGDTGREVTVKKLKLVTNTAPVFNKVYNLGNPKNYCQFQDFPTSLEYLSTGRTRPLTGACATGEYALDPEAGTVSVKAIESNGVFWYSASMNTIKIDMNRAPKLKFTIVDSGDRWTLQLGIGDNMLVSPHNQYGGAPTSGDMVINLENYEDELTPYASAANGQFELGVMITVLTNGADKATVLKDLRIEYENPDPIEEITEIPEVNLIGDTLNPAVLPSVLTVNSENYKGREVDILWTADAEYTTEIAGVYTFTAAFDTEQLYNFGLSASQIAPAAVITLKTFMLGNVNNDDYVNVLDLIRLKKYFSDMENVDIYWSAADIDENGTIESNDLVALRKLLLGVTA